MQRIRLLLITLYIILIFSFNSFSQVIPVDRQTDWNNPGSDGMFLPSQSINLLTIGADSTGTIPSDAALQQAIIMLNGPGEIYIPGGQYLFEQTVNLPDSIILQGEVDTVTNKLQTKLILAPGNNHGIIISGSETNSGVTITYPLMQGEQKIYVDQSQLFNSGDFIKLKAFDDSSLVNDFWAYHSTGQIFEILQIINDSLFLNKPLRRSYTGNPPQIIKLNPARQVHLKCLIIERDDISTSQTSNIFFQSAVDCSVSGLESYLCNFAHINIYNSSKVTVENSYFKDGHSYGSGGKAYGVMIEYNTGDCYIHQNNFEHLRHSIIFQSGANGNVVAYNYSKDPYWTGTILPANSAGDLVFHGNYPYMNLLEGNVIQNIVIDNSHGKNGPNNLFFRNRAELYGIFMNNSPASDQQTFIGNQVTNTSSSLYGMYLLQGVNHFEYGNQIKGNVLPAGTGEPIDSTLFQYTFNSFYQSISSVPPIRNNNWLSTTPHITAEYQKDNLLLNSTCEEIIYTGTSMSELIFYNNIKIYPNPFKENIFLNISENLNYKIINTSGIIVSEGKFKNGAINTEHLKPGLYFLILEGKEILEFKIVKF
ncbi:MAG: T9SS type A sorting domain-containing protein [Bacteroidia bacterium]